MAHVGRWRAAPHVARWFGDDHSPAELEAEYGAAIDGREPTELFIVELGGAPIGFLQRYLLADHPEWITTLQPAGSFATAAGIDYLIGDRDRTGRGVGTAMIGAFVALTWDRYPGVDCIVTDVDQDNRASWRALERNGFDRVWSGVLGAGHPSPCFVYALPRP